MRCDATTAVAEAAGDVPQPRQLSLPPSWGRMPQYSTTPFHKKSSAQCAQCVGSSLFNLSALHLQPLYGVRASSPSSGPNMTLASFQNTTISRSLARHQATNHSQSVFVPTPCIFSNPFSIKERVAESNITSCSTHGPRLIMVMCAAHSQLDAPFLPLICLVHLQPHGTSSDCNWTVQPPRAEQKKCVSIESTVPYRSHLLS